MTKSGLAKTKAWNGMALLFVFVELCVFCLTYGRAVVQRAANDMSQEATMGGLGPAFAFVFALIFLGALAVPAVLLLASAIGLFVTKEKRLVRFVVTALVSEIMSVILLGGFGVFMAEASLYDGFCLAETIVAMLAAIASAVGSVFVLVKWKSAE